MRRTLCAAAGAASSMVASVRVTKRLRLMDEAPPSAAG
jgi:hypothetical protein